MADKTALNDEQQAAVSIQDGPVLVVAGAGTGKTRVIVERILNLIEARVDPQSILALTFTEKAAAEMLDRINEARGGFTLDMTIATYNGFGDELLKMYATEIGLGSMRLLGETGQLVFLREHLDELGLDYFAPISRPDSQLDNISSYISQLKQQIIQPEAYKKFAQGLPTDSAEDILEKQKHLELAHVYDTYIKLCREHHVIDYDDQLFLSVELLRLRPNIKRELQQRYRFVLVDEFQDTNPLQSELLDLLANHDKNIFVVGDDDQSIYGWRGATLANILGFKTRYPDCQEVTLIQNYRSSQAILDCAYQLIQYNNPNRLEVSSKLDKHLKANVKAGPQPQVMHFTSFESELTWVAEDIRGRLQKGQDPASIAVLARRNLGVQRAHEMLGLYGIDHAVAGLSNDLYQNIAVAYVLEALQAVNDPLESTALYHVLSGPLFSIHPTVLSTYASKARRNFISLAAAIREDTDSPAVKALDQIEAWREQSAHQTIGQLAYDIITQSGWKGRLYHEAHTNQNVALQVQAINQLFGTFKEFERISGVASLQSYIANLPTLRSAGNELHDASLDISNTQVNVLSVHRAKGLEWQTVYIIDCTEGSFPMSKFGSSLKIPEALKVSAAADDHMAEERRLMYVAVTRAQTELILSYSDTHNHSSKRRPSRFLRELFGDEYDAGLQIAGNEQTSMELFSPANIVDTIAGPAHLMQDGIYVLSVSQLACWLRCPQDFYYCFVLQMPEPEDPVLAYGTLMHSVVQRIHEGRRDNHPPTLDELLKLARERLPTSGYLTKQSRERTHKQAEKTIRRLYERFMVEAIPIEIERSFAVPIPDANLVMTGRIDAVYDAGKGKVEIRDYKTGDSVRSADKAKQRAISSSQLSLYALAWQLEHEQMPDLLTLDFIETGYRGSVRKQSKTIANLQAKLSGVVKSLDSGTYELGSDHSYCKHPV